MDRLDPYAHYAARFTLREWFYDVLRVAVYAVLFTLLCRFSFGFDPLVVTIYAYTIGHLIIACTSSRRIPGPRHARLIPAALIFVPLTFVFLWNDPVAMMRIVSFAAAFLLAIAVLEFSLSDLIADRNRRATTEDVRLIHGTEIGVYALMLALSEWAIAMDGGWAWIVAAATFRLAGRRAVPALSLRFFRPLA